MGLTPKEGESMITPTSASSRLQQAALTVVRNTYYEGMSVVVVLLSSALMGWQTDYMARHMQSQPEPILHAIDLVFLLYFIVELALKLTAYRHHYFTMWGWGFNILDLLLVVLQVFEEVASAITSQAGQHEPTMLMWVRAMRAARVLRIFHVMRFAEELRLLVSCIMYSSRSFTWAVALILLMVYVVGVHFTQIALITRLGTDSSVSTMELERWFGRVPRSVLSLFQGLTGGVDWNDLVDPLITHISPWLGVLFCMYTSFAILAVMNVVTATFVQQAIERGAEVKDRHKRSRANALFRAVDEDHEGFITFDEIEKHLASDEVKDFFRSIDVDLSEARSLFDMLDTDNQGEIQFAEFLSGCMRLQGPARAIDLVLVMRNLMEAFQKSLEVTLRPRKGKDEDSD